MTIHEILWEMTKRNNFYVKMMKHYWLDGEPMLPTINHPQLLTQQELDMFGELPGVKFRNIEATGKHGNATCSSVIYIDYPENKPYLVILLEMTNRVNDIHGKSTPITRALTVIDNYENNPN